MANRIADVMTRNIVTVDAAAPVVDAARMMRDDDIGNVIVSDGGRVAGIVTDRDIVVRAAAEGRDSTATKLADISTDSVITVDPDDPVENAVRLMRERAVRRIVVVEDEVPIGVLSMGDMARRRDPGSVLADVVSAPATG